MTILPQKKRLYNYNKRVGCGGQEQTEPLDLTLKKIKKLFCWCGTTFIRADRFRTHQRRHLVKDSGRYQCKVCNKNFVQDSSLNTHSNIHTGYKPYHCDVCGNSYGDLSTFTKHKRTHTGEKPYECKHCGKCFSQSGNKIRHIKTVHKIFD